MKRLACNVCGGKSHLYESQTLQVVACYFCLKSVADFLVKYEILTIPNILKDELLAGVWECPELDTPFQYQVWHMSRYSSTAQTYTMVERFEEKVSEGLDIN